MNVSIPTDDDSFFRRECPTCEQQFKWHLGPINDEASNAQTPDAYFCPLCGVHASTDQWWTKEQLEYAQVRALPDILAERSNDTGLRIDSTSEVTEAMTEPNDMDIVQSPMPSGRADQGAGRSRATTSLPGVRVHFRGLNPCAPGSTFRIASWGSLTSVSRVPSRLRPSLPGLRSRPRCGS